MKYCCVKHCKNNLSETGISLFSFLKNASVRLQWAEVVNRPGWMPKKESKICSAHFAPHFINGVRLRSGAYPSKMPEHVNINSGKFLFSNTGRIFI